MRSILTKSSLLIILTLPAVAPACRGADAEPAFEPVVLGDGIVLLRPTDPASGRTNSMVVEREDGLLVIEAQPDPEAARDLLAAVRTISPAPIRYLVLSHPHVESWGGAEAFPESTLLIAAARARDLLEDDGFEPGAEERARAGDAESWVSPPLRPAVLLAHAPLELDDGRNPVRLSPAPPAHTLADLIVELQGGRILYVGPLLFEDRNPFARDGSVTGWLNTLNSVASRAPDRVVPLRGPAADSTEVRQHRNALAWLRGAVETAFVDLVPPEEIVEHVLADPDAARYFDLEADPSFATTVIGKTVEEAIEHRRKRGLM